MSHRIRTFVGAEIRITDLASDPVPQRPPTPAPAAPPRAPSAPPSRSAIPAPASWDISQPREDLVMFMRGRVSIDDGPPVPNNVMVERICNNRVRQQVYASLRSDFSMQLGSRADSFLDASADSAPQNGTAAKDSLTGISRRELTNCELRASASGFHSREISLVDLDFGSIIDVRVIVVQRGTKIKGMTLSAIPYKAPKDARKAYEKGVQAEKNGKLADAHKYFEAAVKLYPNSANAWFQLGSVLQKENEKDAARKAYTQATTVDSKFLPP